MPTITKHEMDRRKAMADAEFAITEAMEGHSLTPLEWVNVLHEKIRFVTGVGLREEWSEDESEASDG